MDKAEYYKENNIEVLREHWISLDVCPSCKSTHTFHSEWMGDKDLQKKSELNIFRLTQAKSREGEKFGQQEQIMSKYDLCLECGHDWVMYIEVIKYTTNEV